MDKKSIRDYIKENLIDSSGGLNKNLTRTDKYKDVINYVMSLKLSENIKESFYLFYNNTKKNICECGNNTTFVSFSKGYREYCSAKCRANSNKFKNNISKTNIEKYGFKNPAQSEEIKNKIKNTNLMKYGVDHNFKRSDVQDERKKTFVNRYGVENPMQAKEIQHKVKNTLIERYGVSHPSKISEVKDKIAKRNRLNFYNKLVNTNRLKDVEILFKLNEFNGVEKFYKFKCKICGNIFESNLDDGKMPRCFYCNPRINKTSNLENEVVDFIKNLNVKNIIKNDKSILNPYELDIYLPDYNFAIEFNGLYWHSELNGKDKNYHLNKTLKCQEKNIQLIHIFEDEWIDKQEIIKSIIKTKIEKTNKIYARKCIIKELESKFVKSFLEKNHIQGYIPSKINLGLYYNDELVSCLSFSKPRYNKNYNWEITRFANKLDTSVVGGFAKLLNYFRNKYDGSIITYSDLRYFNGDIYKSNNFEFLEKTKPKYYYVNHSVRRDRQQFQKHKLKNKLKIFDPNLTEWENMQLNGWDRIWDCGNNKFILR